MNSKKLGQYFLINRKLIEKIIASLAIKAGDTIIEIGAGHGELTKKIAEKCQVFAIEKDKKMAAGLENLKLQNVQIIQDDALKILPQIIGSLPVKNYKIAGNIPYYITGRLLRLLSEVDSKPNLCVFMLQKEVAERICAKPPKMNRLAAIVQFWATPQIISFVPRESFKPKPKVESAIVRLITSQQSTVAPRKYYKMVKILFRQPRKTILNNLVLATRAYKIPSFKEKIEIIEKLEKLRISFTQRPQILSIEQIISLTKDFEN